ncbi:MAG: hypothetical protein AAFZ65_17435 [Planctomycetota bacterium]
MMARIAPLALVLVGILAAPFLLDERTATHPPRVPPAQVTATSGGASDVASLAVDGSWRSEWMGSREAGDAWRGELDRPRTLAAVRIDSGAYARTRARDMRLTLRSPGGSLRTLGPDQREHIDQRWHDYRFKQPIEVEALRIEALPATGKRPEDRWVLAEVTLELADRGPGSAQRALAVLPGYGLPGLLALLWCGWCLTRRRTPA